jgi:hypothetical protein
MHSSPPQIWLVSCMLLLRHDISLESPSLRVGVTLVNQDDLARQMKRPGKEG